MPSLGVKRNKKAQKNNIYTKENMTPKERKVTRFQTRKENNKNKITQQIYTKENKIKRGDKEEHLY